MPRPALEKDTVRVLASAAVVCTGTVASVLLAPHAALGAAAATGLASLANNVLAADLHKKLSDDLWRSDEVLRNHDLRQAVGNAVRAVIDEEARYLPPGKERRALQRVARKAREHWLRLTEIKGDELAGVAEPKITLFFGDPEAAVPEALTPETWRDLLQLLSADRRLGRNLSQETLTRAAEALVQKFPAALRQVLKHDFETGGRAYAGLELLLLGKIVAATGGLQAAVEAASEDVKATVRAECQQILQALPQVQKAAVEQGMALYETLDTEQRTRHAPEARQFVDLAQEFYASFSLLLDQGEANTVQILRELHVIREEIARLRPAAEIPPPWKVPPYTPELFTGREGLLRQLQTELGRSRRAVLHGLPGVGKTLIAIAYAHRRRGDYQGVLWVNADTRDTLNADFAAIALLLGLRLQEEREPQVIVAAVTGELQRRQDWLLIFDNADDLAVVREFLPSGDAGSLLLTLRAPHPVGLGSPIPVEKMDETEGALLLLRRAGLLRPDAALATAGEEDQDAARAICRVVDGLPLALDQAGAFIAVTPSTPAEYLELYRRQGAELRAERGEASLHGSDAAVTVTFSLAFRKVEAASLPAADLLRLCAFLAPDNIPEEILIAGAPELGENLGPAAASDTRRTEAIREAGRYSLLQRDPRAQMLTVHRLVQDVLKDGMIEKERLGWEQRAVRAVNRAFPSAEVANWPRCERLLPHARVCARQIEQTGVQSEEAGRLLHHTAYYLSERAEYAEAERLHQRSLIIWGSVLGSEHPDVARGLNHLASLYYDQARYAEAEPLYKRALAIQEQVFGFEHRDVAASLNNLALLYQRRGHSDEAEPLLWRALAIREKVLGSEHSDVAVSLGNLALLYRDQGRYAEAEPLCRRSLEILERVLGPEHPDMATSLNNLAALYHEQHRYAEAEPLCQQSLAILERILGPDHPKVATALKNYAVLLRVTGRAAGAAPLEARAAAIRARHARPEPPA